MNLNLDDKLVDVAILANEEEVPTNNDETDENGAENKEKEVENINDE